MIDLKTEFEAAGTTEGVYHLSGGETGYSYCSDGVEPNEDGQWDLRYESGWYCGYNRDGTRPIAGVIVSAEGARTDVPGGDKRNIVKFEAMSWADAVKKYPNLAGGFPP